MTGARGRKNEPSSGGSVEDEVENSPDRSQPASKKEIKKTRQLVDILEGKIEGLNDTIDNLNLKLQSADTKFSQHDLKLAYLEAKTKQLSTENRRLRERVDILENDRRGMNLKIDGIVEEEQENLSDIVLGVATALGVRCQPPDIKFVYRIGRRQDRGQQRRDTRPRPILVQFKSLTVRDNIFYSRAKLRGVADWRQVYINDDVNESTRKKREDLRAVGLLCKTKNIDHRLHADAIIINGRKFTQHQLDSLPAGLKIADAKTIKTDKGILFQSEHSFLSSFYEAPFVIEDKVHNTVEHGYNYGRAVDGERPDIAELILDAPTPQEAKRLGKLVQETPALQKGKKQRMQTLQREKFKQNPELQMKLVQTGDLPLLEATTDEFFGIGRPLNAKLLQELTWTGSNHLGDILGNLRDEFIGE